MVTVVLFHHAQGLTEGVTAFADRLRRAGHDVVTPDLYAGETFDTLDDGVGHAEQIGFGAIIDRGVQAADEVAEPAVYAGFSLGAMPAQRLAQQRPDARGAVLLHSAVPLGEFGDDWPTGVPLQMHIMTDDPWDDLPVMEQLADAGGELFTYPGDRHLFTDSSLDEYDPAATEQVVERTLRFLADVDGA